MLYRVLASTGQSVAEGGGVGGNIVWGGAADDQNVYYGAGGSGLVAFRLATGEKLWAFKPPATGGTLGAAPTAIPGVVFEGSSNGHLYAVSAADGKQIWEFNTAQELTTVNQVPAHGGAISVSGPVISGGMVFVSSGYAITSGASGGNLLLAFSVE